MSDERLRDLEREAATGDPEAIEALARERCRSGLCCAHGKHGITVPPKGIGDLVRSIEIERETLFASTYPATFEELPEESPRTCRTRIMFREAEEAKIEEVLAWLRAAGIEVAVSYRDRFDSELQRRYRRENEGHMADALSYSLAAGIQTRTRNELNRVRVEGGPDEAAEASAELIRRNDEELLDWQRGEGEPPPV